MKRHNDIALVTLGRTIRERRKQLGLTIEGLALEAEIDMTYMSSIERGFRNPSFLVMLRIAKVLQTKLGELLAPMHD